ncbi:MAG: hypothetical protein FJX25_10585 [Alphaproteobacteria bacterium]|nr:hypothetical protein [Alphaproteobacteria bacterium]
MSYHVMIVEDEYWTALDLAVEVEDRGAIVTGPFSSVSQAIEVLRGPQRPDVAILDIRLRNTEVFPVADLLMQDGIPFVFTTAYLKRHVPQRFAEAPHFEKPFMAESCVDRALALAKARSCGSRSRPGTQTDDTGSLDGPDEDAWDEDQIRDWLVKVGAFSDGKLG